MTPEEESEEEYEGFPVGDNMFALLEEQEQEEEERDEDNADSEADHIKISTVGQVGFCLSAIDYMQDELPDLRSQSLRSAVLRQQCC